MGDIWEQLGFEYFTVGEEGFFNTAMIFGTRVRDFHAAEAAVTALSGPLGWRWKKGIKWRRISHQAGGIRCIQFHFIAFRLTLRRGVQKKINELDRRWYSSNATGHTLDELNEYRQDLHELLGADCNRSYRDFAEAIYPIDLGHPQGKTVRRFARDVIPDDPDDLVRWRKGWEQIIGGDGRWGLWVLGTNSD